MPRYKLTIEYDGTEYAGWQKQPDRLSVQQALEEAVFKFCGEQAEMVGAGRTDAGVHALAQVAHLDLTKTHDPFRVQQAVNQHLLEAGQSVAIVKSEPIAEDFHARFSATRRHYRYHIINRRAPLTFDNGRAWRVIDELDAGAMQNAANALLGKHDFTSFRDTECQAKSPEKTLDRLDVMRHGEHIFVETNARSFLHHQVRIMVGTLTMVGKGKWTVRDVEKALAAKDRAAAGPTAPPDGLYLVKVDY